MSIVDSSSADIGETSIRKKRTRKRKSRTRVDADDEVSEREDADGPSKKSTKTSSLTEEPKEKPAKVDVEAAPNDQSESDDISSKPKEKRKRKRTRNKSKKEESTTESSREERELMKQPQVKSSPAIQQYLEDLGDPHDHSAKLCEKTINALAYARQYHLARSEWKFNKAKQEYLIRHMLTPPPAASQSTKADKIVDEAKDEEAEDGDTILDQQHWPDEWNKCVAKYLATIQGKAKERLFDNLTKAAEQVIPMMPAQIESAIASNTTPASNAAISEKKSVSFGDLAMAQDASTNEAQDSSASISVADIQRRQFQKDRAARLLAQMRE